MTPTISTVTVCKNRLPDLKTTLPLLVEAGFHEVILVDYKCPQHSGEWARAHYPSVKVLDIDADDEFNISRGRNTGATAATGNWLFFIDADILVTPDFPAYLTANLRAHRYLGAERSGPRDQTAWGSFLVPHEDFKRVGGYDEVYRGWGSEDIDIYYKLRINGLRKSTFPHHFISEIPTPEADRMRYSPVRQRAFQHLLNHIYFRLKKQIWAMSGRHGELPLAMRQSIYASITEQSDKMVSSLRTPGAIVKFSIRLPSYALRALAPLKGLQTVSVDFEIMSDPALIERAQVIAAGG